jgi:hypothetical protein
MSVPVNSRLTFTAACRPARARLWPAGESATWVRRHRSIAVTVPDVVERARLPTSWPLGVSPERS